MPKTDTSIWDDNLTDFLAKLTDLAHKHHIGFSDEGVLYELEPDDYERTFGVTEQGHLEFV